MTPGRSAARSAAKGEADESESESGGAVVKGKKKITSLFTSLNSPWLRDIIKSRTTGGVLFSFVHLFIYFFEGRMTIVYYCLIGALFFLHSEQSLCSSAQLCRNPIKICSTFRSAAPASLRPSDATQ